MKSKKKRKYKFRKYKHKVFSIWKINFKNNLRKKRILLWKKKNKNKRTQEISHNKISTNNLLCLQISWDKIQDICLLGSLVVSLRIWWMDLDLSFKILGSITSCTIQWCKHKCLIYLWYPHFQFNSLCNSAHILQYGICHNHYLISN